MPARLVPCALLTSTLLAAACSSPTTPTAATQGAPGPAASPAPAPSSPAPAPTVVSPTARYRVTFESVWSASTHPDDFPSTAHFSPLVGGTHTRSVVFWREGELASQGIKDMSERGRTTPLDQEIAGAIAAGTAEHVFTGGAVDRTPGIVSLEFEVSQRYPLVTLVSMVAPSPDWFVGVSALPIFDNGQWIETLSVPLVPWDAGTDSGSTFASPDLVTVPPAPISRILGAPLSPGGRVTPLGTFTFRRLAE